MMPVTLATLPKRNYTAKIMHNLKRHSFNFNVCVLHTNFGQTITHFFERVVKKIPYSAKTEKKTFSDHYCEKLAVQNEFI